MKNNSINYIEFPMRDKANTIAFYQTLFGWKFTEWGERYVSFSGAGVDGGFNGEDATVSKPGVLVVLYTDDLEQAFENVIQAGGEIVKPIYSFPGGRRFHFLDPNGTELAIWSDPEENI